MTGDVEADDRRQSCRMSHDFNSPSPRRKGALGREEPTHGEEPRGGNTPA